MRVIFALNYNEIMPKEETQVFKIINGKGRKSILLSGYISPWDKINFDLVNRAIKELEDEGTSECDLLINSGGGSTIEGLTIGDTLKNSTIKFNGIVIGMAASMAGALLQFCDTRHSYPNARLMTHKVKAGAWGESDQIRAMADLADQEEEKIINEFIERTGLAEAKVKEWFKPGVDKWFNAKDALKNKLVDSIIKPVKGIKNLIDNSILNSISNEMELVNAFDPVFQSYVAENVTENKLETEINMNIKEVIALFAIANLTHNLTENSTQPEIDAQLKKVFNEAKKANDYKTELDTHKKTQAETLINQAVTAGKLKATEKESWIKDATANYKVVATAISRMNGKPDIQGMQQRETPEADSDAPEIMKGREEWTLDKWQDEAPEDLEKLENEAPKEFDKLFNKKYK